MKIRKSTARNIVIRHGIPDFSLDPCSIKTLESHFGVPCQTIYIRYKKGLRGPDLVLKESKSMKYIIAGIIITLINSIICLLYKDGIGFNVLLVSTGFSAGITTAMALNYFMNEKK